MEDPCCLLGNLRKTCIFNNKIKWSGADGNFIQQPVFTFYKTLSTHDTFLHRLKMLTYCNVRVDNIFQLHYLLFFQTHLVSLFTIRIFNLPGQDGMFSVAPNLHCRVLVYCAALHCIVVRILLLHVLFEKERKNLI